jgi:hypothetical protein
VTKRHVTCLDVSVTSLLFCNPCRLQLLAYLINELYILLFAILGRLVAFTMEKVTLGALMNSPVVLLFALKFCLRLTVWQRCVSLLRFSMHRLIAVLRSSPVLLMI